MNREEIHERYWQKLIRIRKAYSGHHCEANNIFVYYKVYAERERDMLLKIHGHEPARDTQNI